MIVCRPDETYEWRPWNATWYKRLSHANDKTEEDEIVALDEMARLMKELRTYHFKIYVCEPLV